MARTPRSRQLFPHFARRAGRLLWGGLFHPSGQCEGTIHVDALLSVLKVLVNRESLQVFAARFGLRQALICESRRAERCLQCNNRFLPNAYGCLWLERNPQANKTRSYFGPEIVSWRTIKPSPQKGVRVLFLPRLSDQTHTLEAPLGLKASFQSPVVASSGGRVSSVMGAGRQMTIVSSPLGASASGETRNRF